MDRHIVHVITNRASYGRVKCLLNEIKNTDGLKLTLIKACSAINMDIDFDIKHAIDCLVSSDDHTAMVKTTSLLAMECSSLFAQLKPDIVLIHGDRYEQLGVAMAASYLNIPIAHTEGGETSGCIDDKVRNAITALADIHFAVTTESFTRLHTLTNKIVLRVGSPAIDLCKKSIEQKWINMGDQPYILVLHHPNTTQKEEIEPMIRALNEVQLKKVWINCNVDSGSVKILKRLHEENWEFKKNLTPEEYYDLLNNCACAVGNSSSFIKEGAFLGVPAVIIGKRQNKREMEPNVICCTDNDEMAIYEYICDQLDAYRYKPSNKYGVGNASELIVDALKEVTL